MTGTGFERLVRPQPWGGAGQSHQRGIPQHSSNKATSGRTDRHGAEDLLRLDTLRARHAQSLHHQIETIVFLFVDVVVVDRGAQELASPRGYGTQRQYLITARQR